MPNCSGRRKMGLFDSMEKGSIHTVEHPRDLFSSDKYYVQVTGKRIYIYVTTVTTNQ
jgi:hypothetical protein